MKKVFLSFLVLMLLMSAFAQEEEKSVKQSIDLDLVKLCIDEASFSYVREFKEHHLLRVGLGYQYMNNLFAGRSKNYFHFNGPTLRLQYAHHFGGSFYIGTGGVLKYQYFNDHDFFYEAQAYQNPVSFKEDYRGVVYGQDFIFGFRSGNLDKENIKFFEDIYFLLGYRFKHGERYIHSVEYHEHMYDQSSVSEGMYPYSKVYLSVGFGVRLGCML